MDIHLNDSTNTHPTTEPLGKLSDKLIFAYWGLFWSFFTSGFLMPLDIMQEPSRIFKIVNYISYLWIGRILLLLLTNIKPLYKTCIKSNHSFNIIVFLIVLSLFQLMNGLLWIETAPDARFLATDFIPMFALGTACFAGCGAIFSRNFTKMVTMQAFLAGLFSLYMFITAPIDAARGNLSSPHFLALSTSFISLFALGNIHLHKALHKVLAIISYILFVILMISYQSRGGSINLLVIFPIAFIFTRLKMRNIDFMKHFIIIALVVFSFLYISVQIPFIREELSFGWEGTTTRLYGGETTTDITNGLLDSFSSEMSNVRGAEAREFLAKATLYTWLLGHGWGGSWKSDLMAGGDSWYMVHIGPINLLLKGGILLVISYIYLLLTALRRSWQMVPYNSIAPGCFCYILCYFVDFMKHGPVLHGTQIYILWLIIGISLIAKSPVSEKHE